MELRARRRAPFEGNHYRLERPLNLPQNEEIEKTCAFAFDVGENGEKVGEVIGGLRWLASMGIETVIGFVPQVHRIKPLEVIGQEVIPEVADL